MGFNWKKYVPTITWKQKPNEEALMQYILEQDNTIRALNFSAGLMMVNNDNLKQEVVTLLSAIAMQHGGELRIKQEFFEAIKGDDTANLNLVVHRLDDGDVVVKLEVEEQNAEETDDKDERDQ